MMILCTVTTAFSQTVMGLDGLDFGSLYRSSTGSIEYISNAAAQFSVVAKEKKTIRLTVTVVHLKRDSKTLPITVTNNDCAYSLDDGANWITFSTGSLYQDIPIPKDNDKGNRETILVRVGGSVTASATQQRGNYSGTVSLSVSYI